MPTNLPGTDVVVIGLGAAGGVAVLPLADAGLNVVGLEAGTWLTNDPTRAGRIFSVSPLAAKYTNWGRAGDSATRTINMETSGAKESRKRD